MALDHTVAHGDDVRHARRVERYRALRLLWRLPQYVNGASGQPEKNDDGYLTPVTKVSQCQRWSILPSGEVKVLVTPTPDGPRAGFKGLLSCGSVWVCPACSHKIAQRRAEEISAAIESWTSRGGQVVMLTLTMRHDRTQPLDQLWDGLSHAWHRVTSGGAWVQDQERYGVDIKGDGKNRIGWVRAVEATHGANGWHLHIHALLFLDGDFDENDLAKSMFQRWRAALISKGLSAPIYSRGGCDVKRIVANDASSPADVMSGYFTKATYDGSLSAGMEMTRGGHKTGRNGGRTPFQLLSSVVEHLDDADDAIAQRRAERDLARWYEWERASKGKRQITWSRGLRDFLRLDEEVTDEEIVTEDAETDSTVTLHIIGARCSARGLGDSAVRR